MIWANASHWSTKTENIIVNIQDAQNNAYLMVYATIRLRILTPIMFRTSIQSMWFNYANKSTTDYSNWCQKWRGPRHCRHYSKYNRCIYNIHVYMKFNVHKTQLIIMSLYNLIGFQNKHDTILIKGARREQTHFESCRMGQNIEGKTEWFYYMTFWHDLFLWSGTSL